MKSLSTLVLILMGLTVFGQQKDFRANFINDSLGTNGFRLKAVRYDSVKKKWLINNKNVMHWPKDQIFEFLGPPHKDCMFMNGCINNYYYLNTRKYQLVLLFDGYNKVNGIDIDTTDFSDSRGCGEEDAVTIKSSEGFDTGLHWPIKKISIEQPIMKLIRNKDTIMISEQEDSIYYARTSISNYLKDHLNYPEVESEAQITGTVYVLFTINKDSTISNFKILKGIPGGPGIDKEVRRVFSNIPKQVPYKKHGQPQKTECFLAIRFFLQ